MNSVSNWIRIGVGFAFFAVATTLCMVVCFLLLPFRNARIKTCNYYGQVTGRIMMWFSGCPISLEGREHLDGDRPAIYISNHTSLIDAFVAMWLSPIGTVGIVKKEIIYYPFFGQMYLLSGHLRIDRGKSEKARAGMRELAERVRKGRLSIFVWPEGTRSRTGELLPFKKGFYHLAKQTGLPLVPIVVSGAHQAWQKNSMKVANVPIRIQILPPVSTEHWTNETISEHLAEVEALFKTALPEDQRPAEAA